MRGRDQRRGRDQGGDVIREWSGGDLIGLVEDEAAQLRHDTAGRRPATHSLIYPYLLSRSWVTILRAAGRPLTHGEPVTTVLVNYL